MVQETLTNYGVLVPKTAHAEMTALLDVFARNFRVMTNYSIPTNKSGGLLSSVGEARAFLQVMDKMVRRRSFSSILVSGDHFTMLRRPNVRIIAEALQRYLSMNSNNESRAESLEVRRSVLHYFMLYWLTRAYRLVHSENEFVVAICNSLLLRDELAHEWRTLRWRAFFRTFVSHSGY